MVVETMVETTVETVRLCLPSRGLVDRLESATCSSVDIFGGKSAPMGVRSIVEECEEMYG